MQLWYLFCIVQIFRFLGPGSISIVLYTLYSYCITFPYNTCVCVTILCLLYITIFQFLTYFSAVFFHSTLSVIIPYSVKADIALIHAEGLKLIRDRYLELCQKPTPCLFINLFNVGLRGLVLVRLDDPSNQLQT